jgi:hypothetical protein
MPPDCAPSPDDCEAYAAGSEPDCEPYAAVGRLPAKRMGRRALAASRQCSKQAVQQAGSAASRQCSKRQCSKRQRGRLEAAPLLILL